LALNPAAITPKVLKQKTKAAMNKASCLKTSYLPVQFKDLLAKVHQPTFMVLSANFFTILPT
jgi:hypothetical protein